MLDVMLDISVDEIKSAIKSQTRKSDVADGILP